MRHDQSSRVLATNLRSFHTSLLLKVSCENLEGYIIVVELIVAQRDVTVERRVVPVLKK